ncbi:glucomannan 4-beta-mannosyltransferase 9-like isoform X1 [Papaver somniferum]|uniref:glucomannan 4-beta-mannosyltransferase 9-like isoform X1 n=1 Tax=Papaver somniferum TaxID=3469 RepID=UPI000E6F575B|nr:glucomannan 4-beta-mannosyltransferase 9-like isoform X1 [Papaver somniferum]
MDLVSLIPQTVLQLIRGGVVQELRVVWQHMRELLIVPILKFAVFICLAMSVMLFIDRVYMGIVILFLKLSRRKPEKHYKWEEIKDDIEMGNSTYPMVLVQVPMYNEKEVYQLSIGAACALSWPSDRIIIQVLDDSTNLDIKGSVQTECQKWASKGINIYYEARTNRNGYKAGALKEGLEHDYVETCDFVVIFDADFQPDPDFLRQTIPYFVHNPDIGLVQARWEFVNANECLQTRVQEMSLNYHFGVEQEVGSSTYAFFGFNGTAGVWRIDAIKEAGGWKDRTTVEDMDLAVRASLAGWKFVYIGNLKVKNELPSTFKAFRYQQHRWSCGPANLFRKMFMEIIKNKTVHLWKKIYVIYSFFLVRKIVAHIVTFFFYCVIIPTCVFFPEVELPIWDLFYLPTVITILNAIETPRSLHLVVFWILFDNVMALHRTKGTFIGLFEAGGRVKEWVVTEKLGDALLKPKENNRTVIKPSKRTRFSAFMERVHLLEVGMGTYILVSACYDARYGKYWYFIYLFGQAIAFLVMGFGHVGTMIPPS